MRKKKDPSGHPVKLSSQKAIENGSIMGVGFPLLLEQFRYGHIDPADRPIVAVPIRKAVLKDSTCLSPIISATLQRRLFDVLH